MPLAPFEIVKLEDESDNFWFNVRFEKIVFFVLFSNPIFSESKTENQFPKIYKPKIGGWFWTGFELP